LLTHQLTRAFKQHNQDLQSPTSEGHRIVAFQQKKLRGQQAKRAERDFRWRDARRFGSFLEEWPVRVRTLNGASLVKPRFMLKLG
jgi:hypothetical protein